MCEKIYILEGNKDFGRLVEFVERKSQNFLVGWMSHR